MKTMHTMKTMAAVMATALATMLAGCSAGEGGGEPDVEPEAVTSTEQPLQIGGSVAFKTKGDLERDGYTCTKLEGTSVTLCWKNGAPGYSCNDRGTCTPNVTRNPPPPNYNPPGGGVFAP